MTATRASASLIAASALTGFSALFGVLAAPIAHADPLDNIRASVNTTRTNAGCPPLTYNKQLQDAAQALVRTSIDNGAVGGYGGVTTQASTANDTAQDSINRVNVALDARLHDCSWKDFGVGFYRNDNAGLSAVAVYLGQPPASNKPADNANNDQNGAKPADSPPPVTNAIQASFGDPGLSTLDFNVTNTSALTATCNYTATANSLNPVVPKTTKRQFNVPANGDHTESFKGGVTFTTYNVTLSCKDASGKQKEEMGHVETSVTW